MFVYCVKFMGAYLVKTVRLSEAESREAYIQLYPLSAQNDIDRGDAVVMLCELNEMKG